MDGLGTRLILHDGGLVPRFSHWRITIYTIDWILRQWLVLDLMNMTKAFLSEIMTDQKGNDQNYDKHKIHRASHEFPKCGNFHALAGSVECAIQ